MLNYTPHLCESAAATSQKYRSLTIVLPCWCQKMRVNMLLRSEVGRKEFPLVRLKVSLLPFLLLPRP